MGYHPNCGTNISTQVINESSVVHVKRMEQIWEDASAKLERARTIMKAQNDRHRSTPMEYQPCNMAWLNVTHMPSKKPSKKLDHRYLGPYRVVKKVGAFAYQLTTQGVSNSMLTDIRSSFKERVINYTGIDQNSSGVLLRYMVHLYINLEAQTIPNKCTARQRKMQCRRMMPRSHHLAQELLDP